MIRVPVTKAQLNQLIDDEAPAWRNLASKRTSNVENNPNYNITSIWSDVKIVYMRLQHSKCIFCEKKIEPEAIEQDVEHFRPKNEVKRWPVPSWLASDPSFFIQQPSAETEPGYRLIAYHPRNYAASCKTCNSTYKANYFPIAGGRTSLAKNPDEMQSEQAFLIMPLGDVDDDPEQLIEFEGFIPQAKQTSGHGAFRAKVTIELLGLAERKGLLRERIEGISDMYRAFLLFQTGVQSNIDAAQVGIDALIDAKSRHANCMRCYKDVCETDWALADSIYKSAIAYAKTISTI